MLTTLEDWAIPMPGPIQHQGLRPARYKAIKRDLVSNHGPGTMPLPLLRPPAPPSSPPPTCPPAQVSAGNVGESAEVSVTCEEWRLIERPISIIWEYHTQQVIYSVMRGPDDDWQDPFNITEHDVWELFTSFDLGYIKWSEEVTYLFFGYREVASSWWEITLLSFTGLVDPGVTWQIIEHYQVQRYRVPRRIVEDHLFDPDAILVFAML